MLVTLLPLQNWFLMKFLEPSGESSNVALIVEIRGRLREKIRINLREKSKGRSQSKGKTRLECWHYGKKGHIKKDCLNIKANEV